VQHSRNVPRINTPLVDSLRSLLRRGEQQGVFRRGIDPVQLYISIAGEGYFYLSNRYTLSQIFGRDLMAKKALAARARHNAEMILAAVGRSTPPRRNRIVKR
jgi:hypothetical protein